MMAQEQPDQYFNVPFTSKASMVAGLWVLTSCGHPHNFRVELDHESPMIVTSQLGFECLQKEMKHG